MHSRYARYKFVLFLTGNYVSQQISWLTEKPSYFHQIIYCDDQHNNDLQGRTFLRPVECYYRLYHGHNYMNWPGEGVSNLETSVHVCLFTRALCIDLYDIYFDHNLIPSLGNSQAP